MSFCEKGPESRCGSINCNDENGFLVRCALANEYPRPGIDASHGCGRSVLVTGFNNSRRQGGVGNVVCWPSSSDTNDSSAIEREVDRPGCVDGGDLQYAVLNEPRPWAPGNQVPNGLVDSALDDRRFVEREVLQYVVDHPL